jgi:hypothetical protein
MFLPPLILDESQEGETHGTTGIEHTRRNATKIPEFRRSL